jgi:signal transduction histidine kinase/CheY-like chemotaxis protein
LQNVVARVWPAVKRARVLTALSESEERLRPALESAGAGIWDLNVQTGAMIWSPENCRLYGVEPERYVPKYETWRNLVHPDDLDRIERERQEDTRDSRGELVRMLGINIDVTERKRMEDALREADRKKDEFLAILAHELRNPLAPLRTGLEILKRAGGNLALAENVCDMMDRALTQSVRLVDDLLDISRISRGKLVLKKERVELAAVVRAAVETSRPFVDEKEHELTVTLPSAPVLLDGDPVRLSQVIANLLNNAAKYSDNGGRIQLLAKVESDEALVSVKDSGVGIATEDLPRVFEMFAQLDTASERSQGGLGIGLSLVKALVEMHGGTIEARSAGIGRGSEFVVRLPVASSQTRTQIHSIGSGGTPALSSPKHRILIVDDNRLSSDSAAIALRLMGHEVITAYDGIEAMEVARTFRPNVVLLDIGLPKLNGYETARRIRDQSSGRGIFFIAVTGYGQEADRRRSIDAGFNYHMVKPVNFSELENKLSELPAV